MPEPGESEARGSRLNPHGREQKQGAEAMSTHKLAHRDGYGSYTMYPRYLALT